MQMASPSHGYFLGFCGRPVHFDSPSLPSLSPAREALSPFLPYTPKGTILVLCLLRCTRMLVAAVVLRTSCCTVGCITLKPVFSTRGCSSLTTVTNERRSFTPARPCQARIPRLHAHSVLEFNDDAACRIPHDYGRTPLRSESLLYPASHYTEHASGRQLHSIPNTTCNEQQKHK